MRKTLLWLAVWQLGSIGLLSVLAAAFYVLTLSAERHPLGARSYVLVATCLAIAGVCGEGCRRVVRYTRGLPKKAS